MSEPTKFGIFNIMIKGNTYQRDLVHVQTLDIQLFHPSGKLSPYVLRLRDSLSFSAFVAIIP